MNKPWDEPLTEHEIAITTEMTDIQVVFDVGVRTSLEYLSVWPDATFHLFEPYPPFYEWLQEECKDKPNVHVNGYGLADAESESGYDKETQSFMYGSRSILLPVKTLDSYIQQNEIKRIDFLKIDTEGWDFKVLLGGLKAIDMARYIQYEHWGNLAEFHSLLESKFSMNYIGERNVFCTRK